jgi:Lrp/AsnC family leucine-responsive transcriptional regulator
MEAAGVIEGYAAILSEKALGRSATVFVAVTLENQRSDTMAAFELNQYFVVEIVELGRRIYRHDPQCAE